MRKNVKYADFNFPKINVSLPQGNSAEAFFKACKKELKGFPHHRQSKLRYDQNTKIIYNFNAIDQGAINYFLRYSGLRVAVPRDNFNGDISNLIGGRRDVYLNALVVQEDKPVYKKNNGLWRNVIELAEENQGSVKFPFMTQGYYVFSDETEKRYGVQIVPAPNFEVIEDERFAEEYNKQKFNVLDSKGIPVFNEKGKFTFFTSGNGLAMVSLGLNNNFCAHYDNFANQTAYGTVVLVKDKVE